MCLPNSCNRGTYIGSSSSSFLCRGLFAITLASNDWANSSNSFKSKTCALENPLSCCTTSKQVISFPRVQMSTKPSLLYLQPQASIHRQAQALAVGSQWNSQPVEGKVYLSHCVFQPVSHLFDCNHLSRFFIDGIKAPSRISSGEHSVVQTVVSRLKSRREVQAAIVRCKRSYLHSS